MARVVHEPCRTGQSHPVRQVAVPAWREPHPWLGLGHEFAQCAFKLAWIAQRTCDHTMRITLQVKGNGAWVCSRQLRRIAVHGRVTVQRVFAHPRHEFARQRARRRRAKSDRTGHALADGHAVMRPAWRQVQHVAGVKRPLGFGLEMPKDAQWQPVDERFIGRPTDLPMAPTLDLQQEYVVRVQVRSHAATVIGPGQHQVVKSRFRNEAETIEQLVRGRHVEVQALNQEGPTRRRDGWQAASRKGAVSNDPVLAAAPHQARLDITRRRQLKQRRARHRRRHTRESLAHQQWLLLPMSAHELRRAQATQHRRR